MGSSKSSSWNSSRPFRCSLSQTGEPHLSIREALPPWDVPLISSHVTDLSPVNLISHQMLLRLFLIFSCYFSSLLLLLFQRFWDVFLPSKSKSFPGNAETSQFQHLICSVFSIGNKTWVYEICPNFFGTVVAEKSRNRDTLAQLCQ